jgi:radical SAM protein with 4Fe4S-binding SPASM domain
VLRSTGIEAKLHAALRYAGAATGVALVGPRVVGLEVTHFCNLSCGFCETHGRFMPAPITKRRSYVGERRSMDLDTIRRLAGSLKRIGVDWVELSGKGDPIVHPELPEIVRILKTAGLRCSMFTNGSVQRPGLVAALVDHGLDNLNLSMNAGTREVFAKVTGKDLFERSIAFVAEVLEHRRRRGPEKRPWVRLTTVVCKDNLDDVDAQVELCCRLGVDEGGWCVMGELRETTAIRLDRDDADRLLARVPAWAAKLDAAGIAHDFATFEEDLRLRIGAGPQQDNPVQRSVPCYEGWNHAVISPDGTVAPCCYCENVKLGNVVEQDFEQVWRGEAYQEFRRRSLEMPKTGRAICRECFTSCNRAQMNRTIDQRLHWIGRGGPRSSDAGAPDAMPRPAGG